MLYDSGFTTLKLANVFDDASLSTCAADYNDTSSSDTKVIVKLNKCDEEKAIMSPVFLVHPAGGSITSFGNIATHISDRCMYGIQWSDKYRNVPSLRELASEYVKELKVIQPRGPYTIGGFSLGAAIAWEICHMLEANGEQVR